MLISRRRSEFVCLVDVVRGFCRVLLDCRIGALRRPTSGYNMDLHDTTPGARQRAEADQGPSYSSLLGLGSLGTAAASRVRATASPGVPNVLMNEYPRCSHSAAPRRGWRSPLQTTSFPHLA